MNRRANKCNYLYSLLLVVYTYIDYCIPCIVIFTFPLWVFPYFLFLSFSKIISVFRYLYLIAASIVDRSTPSHLYYAVLKGNGRYLRQDCEQVYTHQFYDYTARRFMSVSELEPDSRIVELECQNEAGLIYLMESNRLGSVVGFQSSSEVLKRCTNSLGFIVPCDYEIKGSPANYDILLLFDFKNKLKNRCCGDGQNVQLMTLLRFCNFHIDTTGYLVYGDYFEKGEVSTYVALFEAFNFVVTEQEDISKNVAFGEKLMKRKSQLYENKVLNFFLQNGGQLLGRRMRSQRGEQFIVFILEKMKTRLLPQ